MRVKLGPTLALLIAFVLLINGAGASAAFRPSAVPRGLSPLNWTQLPGSASQIAVAPDGTLWALATTPAGPIKHILRLVGNRWNVVPGYATGITIAPNGVVSIVNKMNGGVYNYTGSGWAPANNSVRPFDFVSAGADDGLYTVSSNGIVSGNSPVYKSAPNGLWTQESTTGAHVVGAWDALSYTVPGAGTVVPFGYFDIKASGAVSYGAPFSNLAATFPDAASAVAPAPGGFFELAYPASAAGTNLSYFSYSSGTSASEARSFVSIASGASAGGYGTRLYAIDSASRIWTTPVTTTITDATVAEFPTTSASGTLAIALGPDGALWFTEQSTNKIGRMSTAHVLTEFALPAGLKGLTAIASGPDGALWFTATGAIGRITTTGTVSQFAMPGANPGAFGIAAGSDGALWYTDTNDNTIGRVTTSGVFSEYPIPTPSAYATAIVKGPDNAMWFTEFQGKKIGRITVKGAITEYPIATGATDPYGGIAVGSDGALWFTANNTGYIGRITTSGTITSYALPVDTTGGGRRVPCGVAISPGPDGALYFTQQGGLQGPLPTIGRLSTSGVYSQYNIPLATSGRGLTLGPDNAVWFTEDDPSEEPGDSIGRLSLR